MRSVTLKSGVIIFVSVLLLSACDKMKMDKNQSATSKALDLSVKLDVQDNNKTVYQEKSNKRPIQGLFEPKERESNVSLEAHFERPHKENKDRETTPDGAGLGFKVGI